MSILFNVTQVPLPKTTPYLRGIHLQIPWKLFSYDIVGLIQSTTPNILWMCMVTYAVHLRAHMHVEARGQSQHNSSGTSFNSFETGSIISLELTDSANWLASKLRNHPVFALPNTWITGTPIIFPGVLGIKLRSSHLQDKHFSNWSISLATNCSQDC